MDQFTNLLDQISKSQIKEFVIGNRTYAKELTIDVEPTHIVDVLSYLKNDMGFTYLTDISFVDHYTDEQRFEVSYNIVNIEERKRLRISCRLEESQPEINTVTHLWKSADWFEREAYDMMGIIFNNHPDLRRIYMPEDYEYFPLRKEFPLLGIPGSIPLPEKDPPKQYN